MMPSTNDVCRLHKETDCTLQIIGNLVSTDRLTTVDDPKYAIPGEIFEAGKHCREIKYNLQPMQQWIQQNATKGDRKSCTIQRQNYNQQRILKSYTMKGKAKGE